MKRILTIISLTIPLIVNGQYNFRKDLVSRQILSISNKIAKADKFDSEHVYYEAITTEQYKRFEKLTQLGTINELKELMNHPNQHVRVYSFWGLAKKHYTKLDSIILSHKNDNETVQTQSGCIGYQTSVISLLLEIVTPNYWDIKCAKLSKEQLEELYLTIYNRKVNINVEPLTIEQVQSELDSEFQSMKEKTINRDTELKSFKGFAAVLNPDKTKLLVFETNNDFKIYDLTNDQVIDSFSIDTKSDLRADITYFKDDKIIYLGTWKNYKRNKSIFWTFDLKTREKKLIKCDQAPFGCSKTITDSYVYITANETDRFFYTGRKNKFVFGDKYLLTEKGKIGIYKKEE